MQIRLKSQQTKKITYYYYPGKLFTKSHWGHSAFEIVYAPNHRKYCSYSKVGDPVTLGGDKILYTEYFKGNAPIKVSLFSCKLGDYTESESLDKKINHGWERKDHDALSKNCAHFTLTNILNLSDLPAPIKNKYQKIVDGKKLLTPSHLTKIVCKLRLAEIEQEREIILKEKIDYPTHLQKLLENTLKRLIVKKKKRQISFFQSGINEKIKKIVEIKDLISLLKKDMKSFCKKYYALLQEEKMGKVTLKELQQCKAYVEQLKNELKKNSTKSNKLKIA